MMMSGEWELRLPEHIRAKAVMSGNEWGWRRSDIHDAIMAARDVGLANIGGQVQFVFPNGTCELWWKNYDSEDQKPGESWTDYVSRSATQVSTMLQRVLEGDLIAEGIESFSFLADKASQGLSLEDHLVFIAYFSGEMRRTSAN